MKKLKHKIKRQPIQTQGESKTSWPRTSTEIEKQTESPVCNKKEMRNVYCGVNALVIVLWVGEMERNAESVKISVMKSVQREIVFQTENNMLQHKFRFVIAEF